MNASNEIWSPPHLAPDRSSKALLVEEEASMYFTDRGIEELQQRRGDEHVSFLWLTEQMTVYVDLHPAAEETVEGLATWLARLDDD